DGPRSASLLDAVTQEAVRRLGPDGPRRAVLGGPAATRRNRVAGWPSARRRRPYRRGCRRSGATGIDRSHNRRPLLYGAAPLRRAGAGQERQGTARHACPCFGSAAPPLRTGGDRQPSLLRSGGKATAWLIACPRWAPS